MHKARHDIGRFSHFRSTYITRVLGDNAPRPTTFTDAELDKTLRAYGALMAGHHYGKMSRPTIEPLEDDVTVGIVPVYGQRETQSNDTPVKLLLFVQYGNRDDLLRFAIEEHLLGLSRIILEEFGQNSGAGLRAVS